MFKGWGAESTLLYFLYFNKLNLFSCPSIFLLGAEEKELFYSEFTKEWPTTTVAQNALIEKFPGPIT